MEYKWFTTVPCHLVKFLTLLVCEIGKMSKEHKNSFEGEDFPTPLLLEMFTCSSIATTRQICLTKFRDLIPHHAYEFKTDKMEDQTFSGYFWTLLGLQEDAVVTLKVLHT